MVQGALLGEKASSPGTGVWGLGAWSLGAGREAGRIGWAPSLFVIPRSVEEPRLAAGSSEGLGPDSAVDLAK